MDLSNLPAGEMLQGKTAIITGAGSGIGKASVDLFLKQGADVVAADVNYDAVAAQKSEFPDYAGHLEPVKVDVSRRDQVEAMVDTAVAKFGKLDILFNNAGIMDGNEPIDEISDERWNRVMNINTYGVMYACRKAAQYFLERGEGGTIVNTASVGGLGGGKAGAAYTASKYAVVGLTKNIAYMYKKEGIRCNAICPGGVATNISSTMYDMSQKGSKETQKMQVLANGTGDPYQIATVAVYLASDLSSFVNGVAVPVDGGLQSF